MSGSGALSAGTVSLGVKPDAQGFGAKLSSGIMGDSASFGGIGKKIGGLIVGGLALAGIGASIGAVFKTGFDEAKDASAGTAQLAAGIKSTGNAANVTVAGMNDLASSIQGMSGQTDDSIVASEKLLLTFTNIKNVGANKIFDDATLASANMAAKMGGDASSQAILLGKALNDPVKGITALTRVGVSFSDGQKATIAAMVKSGDTMGAQKVILTELNKEFGGAAKAAGDSLPGQLAKSKRAFEDISQSIVEGFMPVVGPAIAGVASALQKATPYVAAFTGWLSDKLIGAMHAVSGAFADFRSGITVGTDAIGSSQTIFAQWGAVVFRVFDVIRSSILPTIVPLFQSMGRAVAPVLASIGAAFASLWPSISPLIPQLVALAMAISPVHLIFTALAPVLPTLIGSIGQLAATLVGALGGALASIFPVVVKVAGLLAGQLVSVIQLLIPIIVKLVGVIGPILGQVLTAVAPLIGMVVGFIGQLLAAVMPLIPIVLSLVMAFVPLLAPLIQLVGAILVPLIQLLSAVLTPVMALVIGLVQFLVPAINLIIQVITWLITNAIAGAKIEFKILGDVIGNIGRVVGIVFGAIGGTIKGAFDGVVSFVKGIFNSITDLVNGIIDGINSATSLGAVIGIHIGKIPHLPHLEQGGTAVHPGSVLVGERGPEILNLPRGASVVPLNKASSQVGEQGMPDSVTLVDADGSILARTHVIAKKTARRTLNDSLRMA